MQSRITQIIILSIISIVMLSCGGSSFYGVFVATRVTDSNSQKPNLKLDDAYLTTHVSIENESIFSTSSDFTTTKNKKLSHLYLYVKSYNLLFREISQIPLLLYTVEKNPSFESIGSDELIIKYPLNNQYRSKFNFTVQSVALESAKSKGTAEFIFGLAKPLVTTATASNPVASGAVNIASEIFEKSYASTEYKYSHQISLKEIENGQVYQAFFIIPISKNKTDSIFKIYKDEVNKDFKVKKFGGKFKLTEDDSSPYITLPYILVRQTVDDHFQDANLLPPTFDANLTILNVGLVDKGRQKLSSLENSLLTSRQYAYELGLLNSVDHYMKLKKKIDEYNNGQQSEDVIVEIVNTFLDFKSLLSNADTTPFFKLNYEQRYTLLSSNVDNLIKSKVPFGNWIKNAIDEFKFDGYDGLTTIIEAEKKLTQIRSITSSLNRMALGDPTNSVNNALKKSRLYQKALFDISILENMIYNRYFIDNVIVLKSQGGCTPAGNAAKSSLKPHLNTSCNLCQTEITNALNLYSNVCVIQSVSNEEIALINLGNEVKSSVGEINSTISLQKVNLPEKKKENLLELYVRIEKNLRDFIENATSSNKKHLLESISEIGKVDETELAKAMIETQAANKSNPK